MALRGPDAGTLPVVAVSATDVVVGRIIRRVRQARLTDAPVHIFGCEVSWRPGPLPGELPHSPPHDGYYEVRHPRRESCCFAYAHLAASFVEDIRMEEMVRDRKSTRLNSS